MYHAFLLTQPCPATPTSLPPSTTAPNPAALPPARLRNASVSGEQLGCCGIRLLPVCESILCSSIHFQFSSSSSGHCSLNLFPPSPALIAPKPLLLLPCACWPEIVRFVLPPPVLFHHLVLAANALRSESDAESEPVVISSLVIKLSTPSRIVETSQAGLKLFGWKSLMLRHSLSEQRNLPLGVCIRIAGGANG